MEWEEWIDTPKIENKESYKVLVLSSGGVHGVVQLGALWYLGDQIKTITSYYGCSVGAIISYLLIIGFTPHEIFFYISNLKMDDIPDLSKLTSKYGVLDWDMIGKHIREMTLKKLDKIPTLSELNKLFDKTLTIVTYNQSAHNTLYVNHKTHPNLNCLDALRMTSSIPIVFYRFEYDNEIYIDGAVSDPFPIKYAKSENPDSNIIGIDIDEERVKPNNFLENLHDLITIPLMTLKKSMSIRESKYVKMIKLHVNHVGHFSFNYSFEEHEKMFLNGCRQAEMYLKRTQNDL